MQPIAPDPQKIEKKQKITLKKIILVVLALLVLAAAGTLGYLYWIERENNNTLESQLNQAKTNQTRPDNTDQVVESAKATYTASVGKFTLTLPDMYYIIVDVDGGFEGGPVTKLDIGTRNDTGTQTVSSPHHARIGIAAYPVASSMKYSERVAAGLAGYPRSQAPTMTKIDGINAEVYILDGLFKDKKVYFTKNDIVYEITAGSVDITEGMLDTVMKGIKLT